MIPTASTAVAEKLLIVEDEAIIAADLCNKLEKLGYEILGSTASGESAIETVQRTPPDLVLMDIVLAGPMDGITTAEIITKTYRRPVLFLTSHVDLETMQRAEVSGSSGFLIKPIDDRILPAQIRMALSKHQVETELRKVNERFVTTLESLSDGFVSWDNSWRYTYVNSAAERLLKRSRDFLLGKDVRELYPEPSFQGLFATLATRRVPITFEEYSPRTGYWFEIRLYPSPDGWTAYFRDITEHKKLDDALEKQNEQLTALSSQLLSIREEEKKRLARTIHDDLGQIFSALKMDLSWIERQLDGTLGEPNQPGIRKKVSDMKATAETAIHTARLIAQELHPSIIDDLGFVVALEWQLKNFRERTEVETLFSNTYSGKDFPPTIALELFRIFQECLLNISRHAQAKKVTVLLSGDGTNFRMEISDDGCGLPPTNQTSSKTLGIISMRERAHGIGGDFQISTKPGAGTSISITVPEARLQS